MRARIPRSRVIQMAEDVRSTVVACFPNSEEAAAYQALADEVERDARQATAGAGQVH